MGRRSFLVDGLMRLFAAFFGLGFAFIGAHGLIMKSVLVIYSKGKLTVEGDLAVCAGVLYIVLGAALTLAAFLAKNDA